MIREIKGLSAYAHMHIMESLPRLFSVATKREDGDFDVTLNESAIMKVYDDLIMFDLGGEKESIMKDDFITISIA